ncbi:hypothetical protein HK104_004917 [Borealophlyctis nickersoniae]|nr:hypothetical protein HK104_004917 [Borealophlyctis nickersoniae]
MSEFQGFITKMQHYITAYGDKLKAHCGGQANCECGFHKLAFNLGWVCELMGRGTSLKNRLLNGMGALEHFIECEEDGDPYVPHDVGGMVLEFQSMIEARLAVLRIEEAERAQRAEDLPAYTN